MPSQTRPPQEEPRNDWLDRLERFNAHFGRFLRDVGGVILLALAAMTLMALWGVTRGVLLTPWAGFLELWLGWGSHLFVLGLALAGLHLLRRDEKPFSFGWVISFELASFLTLGLIAAFGGFDLARAELGMDGGRLGWGLGRFFTTLAGETWGIVLLGTLWLFFMLGVFNVWARVEQRLHHLAETEPSPHFADSQEKEKEIKTEAKPREPRKRAPAIPPEFRTSLRPQETKDEKPVKPQPRSERLPPLNLFSTEQSSRPDERTINQTAGLIMKTLSEFGIPAQVIGYRVGPAVTQFAVQPGFIKKPGSNEEDAQQMKVRVAQIAALEKDLTLALSAERLRIEAPVPGKPYVGIEVPNSRTSMVRLRPILETDSFYKVGSPLAIALGRDVSGQPLVADLARMPHLLIAGATGSGKSVCITSIAACLAINNAPEDLRLVMIDSKMVELLRFNGLPHLFGKVETDIQRILGVLRWVVVEMEHRYRLLEGAHARDLNSYNRKLARRKDGVTPLPRIVVIIDELADLMMSAPDVTEHNLVRLAQMARATGIHLVVATQRPSTDVVTGLIKANFPARISFSMASGVDSRVILDTGGAETLLGRGDMLFLNPEVGNPIRAQGVMVTDQEIEKLISHWQKMTTYSEELPPWEKLLSEPGEGEDDGLVEQAITIVRETQRASASLLQRRLRIGYPRAARLLDQLEAMGIVGESQGGGRERDVLIGPDDEMDEEE
ncbi:MAG: DNA translocase FtsK [Anaerolineaceae bacterium]|nr:MAG: DNA translocase FtsK [Anaerolineaceae bacterium]